GSTAAPCSITNASVTTVETATAVTVRWNNFAQWPAANPGLTFSFKLDKTFYAGGPSGPSRIIFDYSPSVTPSTTFSQPGGNQGGLLVGLKPAGTSAATPR